MICRTRKIRIITWPLWGLYVAAMIFMFIQYWRVYLGDISWDPRMLGWLPTLLILMFGLSTDYTITDEGIVWGSWILRVFRFRNGYWVIRPWKNVRIQKAMYWGFTLFPGPFGHVTPWLYTNSWEFLDEASKRALRTDQSVKDLIRKKINH